VRAEPVCRAQDQEPPKPRRPPTVPEYDRLLAAIEGEQYKLMARLMIESGLRWGECQALLPEDVRDDVLVVAHSRDRFGNVKAPKNGKVRLVQITPELAADLREHLPIRTLRGRPVDHTQFSRRVWHPARERAGLDKNVTTRTLRNSHAIWMLTGGADIVAVRDRLGHASIATTNLYPASLPGAGDSALKALEKIRGR
jgi:integrase